MNKNLIIDYCEFEGCKKKLKLINFKCKCEKTFCILHRLSEQHSCTYEYKNELNNDKKQKEINDAKCISDKIIKF